MPVATSGASGPTTLTTADAPAIVAQQQQVDQLAGIAAQLMQVAANTAQLQTVVTTLQTSVAVEREGFTQSVTRLQQLVATQTDILNTMRDRKSVV